MAKVGIIKRGNINTNILCVFEEYQNVSRAVNKIRNLNNKLDEHMSKE